MSLELDEAQEWRHATSKMAEMTKILNEELIATGLHQDLCFMITRDWVVHFTRPQPPMPFSAEVAELLKRMLENMPGGDDEDVE